MPDPADTPLTRAIEAGSWAETARHGRIGYEVAEVVLRAALPVLADAVYQKAAALPSEESLDGEGIRRAGDWIDAWASEGDQP